LARALTIAFVTSLLACTSTRSDHREAEKQLPPIARPEYREEPLETVYAPIRPLRYKARPSMSVDECLAEAKAAGIDVERRVEVSSLTQLIAALGSATVILLRPGNYVFQDSNKLGEERERAVLPDWSSLSAHYEAGVIHDLHDLVLISLGPEPAVIIQPDGYAPALSFRNVEDLALYNLTIGHRPEQGWCAGGVIEIEKGRNVIVAESTLFGSGTEGLTLDTVDGLTLRDSVITDCSEQFSTIADSRNVIYERVEIVGNREELLRGFLIYRSSVTLVDSVIGDNHPLVWENGDSWMYGVLFAIDGGEVVLKQTVVNGEVVNRTL
jgi:hypothetical protein